ncbi:MAG: cbb3-type cytochrome c oxidase subunit 3 [Kiloniellales bacterium]|nr:cbb3-type cytochrome c oxidase subunit 3 [Kiloniellales bacterium]
MLSFLQEIYEFLRSAWVLWLMLLFCALVARAFWPSRKAEMEAYGQIPLRAEPSDGGDRKPQGER